MEAYDPESQSSCQFSPLHEPSFALYITTLICQSHVVKENNRRHYRWKQLDHNSSLFYENFIFNSTFGLFRCILLVRMLVSMDKSRIDILSCGFISVRSTPFSLNLHLSSIFELKHTSWRIATSWLTFQWENGSTSSEWGTASRDSPRLMFLTRMLCPLFIGLEISWPEHYNVSGAQRVPAMLLRCRSIGSQSDQQQQDEDPAGSGGLGLQGRLCWPHVVDEIEAANMRRVANAGWFMWWKAPWIYMKTMDAWIWYNLNTRASCLNQ